MIYMIIKYMFNDLYDYKIDSSIDPYDYKIDISMIYMIIK